MGSDDSTISPPGRLIPFPSLASGSEVGGEEDLSDPPFTTASLAIARTLYLHLRSRGRPIPTAHAELLRALETKRDRLPDEAPPADDMLIRRWAVQDDWEGRLRAQRSADVLTSQVADPRRVLADLYAQVSAARGVLESATRAVEGPPPADLKGDEMWPSAKALNRWRLAQQTYLELAERAQGVRGGVERADREGTRDDYWEAEYQATLAQLRGHYAGGGPQYDLLTARLASLDVRLRQAERSGRDIPPEEYKALHETHLKYVAQLQKHTETLKSESVQPVQEAVKKLVIALEREIKPTSPEVWSKIVEVTVTTVQELDVA